MGRGTNTTVTGRSVEPSIRTSSHSNTGRNSPDAGPGLSLDVLESKTGQTPFTRVLVTPKGFPKNAPLLDAVVYREQALMVVKKTRRSKSAPPSRATYQRARSCGRPTSRARDTRTAGPKSASSSFCRFPRALLPTRPPETSITQPIRARPLIIGLHAAPTIRRRICGRVMLEAI